MRFAQGTVVALLAVAVALAASGCAREGGGVISVSSTQDGKAVVGNTEAGGVEVDASNAVPEGSIAGFSKLAGLSADRKALLRVKLAERFGRNATFAVIRMDESGGTATVYMTRTDSPCGYLAVTVMSRSVSIAKLDRHVEGVNDELYATEGKASGSDTKSNEGDAFQADTSGNVFLDDEAGLRAIIPEAAAKGLSARVGAWAVERGIPCDVHRSSVNPAGVSTGDGRVEFNILLVDSVGNRTLVGAVFAEADGTLSLEVR